MDTVDTPKKGVEQHRRREVLKDLIKQGKAHRLDGKQPWTPERIDSMTDVAVNIVYFRYIKQEVNDLEEKDPMWKEIMQGGICTKADLERANRESYAYWEKWVKEHMPGYCVEDFDLYHHNCDLSDEEVANLPDC